MLSFAVETIDPEKAHNLLALNAPNRNPAPERIRKYADMMAAGQWELTGEAIKFDEEGYLVDGQNRLRAVIDSGVTITTAVLRGVTRQSMLAMDSGMPRRLADRYNISHGTKYHNDLFAVANHMLGNGIPSRELADVERIRFFEKHMEVIKQTHEMFSNLPTRFRHKSVMSAFAKALYHEDAEKLDSIVQVMRSRRPKDACDDMVLVFRDWLQDIPKDRTNDSSVRKMIHFKAERMISLFCKGQSRTFLFPAANELYPLP